MCRNVIVDYHRGIKICSETGEVLEEGFISDDLLDYIGKIRDASKDEYRSLIKNIYREAAIDHIVYTARVKSKRGYKRTNLNVVLADICRLYYDLPNKEVMKILGLRSVEVYYRIIRKAGCKTKSSRFNKNKKKVSLLLAKEICLRYQRGESIYQLSKSLGRAPSTIKVTLDKWCDIVLNTSDWVLEAIDRGDPKPLLKSGAPSSCREIAPKPEAKNVLEAVTMGRHLKICREVCSCLSKGYSRERCEAETAMKWGLNQGRVKEIAIWCRKENVLPY